MTIHRTGHCDKYFNYFAKLKLLYLYFKNTVNFTVVLVHDFGEQDLPLGRLCEYYSTKEIA